MLLFFDNIYIFGIRKTITFLESERQTSSFMKPQTESEKVTQIWYTLIYIIKNIENLVVCCIREVGTNLTNQLYV